MHFVKFHYSVHTFAQFNIESIDFGFLAGKI